MRMLRSKKMVLQRIPSLSRIYGNKMEDKLAKKATNVTQASYSSINCRSTAHLVNLKIKHIERLKLEELAKGKSWYFPILQLPKKPKRSCCRSFQTSDGHDCSATLYVVIILCSPQCLLCSDAELIVADHILNCRALHGFSVASRYLEARDLMSTFI